MPRTSSLKLKKPSATFLKPSHQSKDHINYRTSASLISSDGNCSWNLTKPVYNPQIASCVSLSPLLVYCLSHLIPPLIHAYLTIYNAMLFKTLIIACRRVGLTLTFNSVTSHSHLSFCVSLYQGVPHYLNLIEAENIKHRTCTKMFSFTF